jgi:hypothetical protein
LVTEALALFSLLGAAVAHAEDAAHGGSYEPAV